MATAAPARTILIVEDDALVRMATSDTLEAMGLQAAEAASAAEAVSVFGNRKIDAAIIDANLPDRNGATLTAELHALSPSLPIIVTSGYSEKSLKRQFGEAAGIFFLPKPFRTSMLEDLLRRLDLLHP